MVSTPCQQKQPYMTTVLLLLEQQPGWAVHVAAAADECLWVPGIGKTATLPCSVHCTPPTPALSSPFQSPVPTLALPQGLPTTDLACYTYWWENRVRAHACVESCWHSFSPVWQPLSPVFICMLFLCQRVPSCYSISCNSAKIIIFFVYGKRQK